MMRKALIVAIVALTLLTVTEAVCAQDLGAENTVRPPSAVRIVANGLSRAAVAADDPPAVGLGLFPVTGPAGYTQWLPHWWLWHQFIGDPCPVLKTFVRGSYVEPWQERGNVTPPCAHLLDYFDPYGITPLLPGELPGVWVPAGFRVETPGYRDVQVQIPRSVGSFWSFEFNTLQIEGFGFDGPAGVVSCLSSGTLPFTLYNVMGPLQEFGPSRIFFEGDMPNGHAIDVENDDTYPSMGTATAVVPDVVSEIAGKEVITHIQAWVGGYSVVVSRWVTYPLLCDEGGDLIFTDGFESGDALKWGGGKG